MIIRKATPQDAQEIATLSTEVFEESYRYPHRPQEMAVYLKEAFNKEKISEQFKDANIHYFIAVDEAIVGFVKINANKWTWRFKGRLTFEVERLYVQKNMEGQQIGSRLMKTALDAAQKRGFRIIWLTAWKNNERAIAFHEQNGFVIIGEGAFTLGETQRTYLVMNYKTG